jgi:hypothetical protein
MEAIMAGDATHSEARPVRIYRDEDSVVTKVAVESEGQTLPAGSEGIVIDVSPIEGYYGIEFFAPFHTVVFLESSQIEASVQAPA